MRTSSPQFYYRNERNAVKLIAERDSKFLNSALPEWIDNEFWRNPLKKFSRAAHLFDNDVFKYAAFYRDLLRETDNFLCNKSYKLPLSLQNNYRNYPWIRKLTSSVSDLHVTMGSCFTNYWDNQKKQRVVDRLPVVRLTDSRGVFIELLGDSENDPNPEYWRLKVLWVVSSHDPHMEFRAFPVIQFFKTLYSEVILKAGFDCIYGYPLSGTAYTESKEEFANSKSWRTNPVTELSSELGNFKINRLTMFFVKTRLCHLAPDLVKEVPGRIMAVMASRSFLTHLYASDDTMYPFWVFSRQNAA